MSELETTLRSIVRSIVREELAASGKSPAMTPEFYRGELSQRDLAHRAGVNPDTISGIEKGTTKAKRSSLFKIADALGVDRNVYAAAALRARNNA